jgi:hypothetical protein
MTACQDRLKGMSITVMKDWIAVERESISIAVIAPQPTEARRAPVTRALDGHAFSRSKIPEGVGKGRRFNSQVFV